ncbi:MAG: Uma2 family endonuclease [Kamptonema sp. SIO4C4]|nr:Uma2 family endonuclease [Kamptonema sp. SIO4C4]
MTPDPTPTAETPPVTVTEWQPQMPPDNLIFDDGEPLESNRHRIGMNVLIRSLNQAFAHRNDFFSGGNMFIYFSREQVRNQDFRGPDFFAVLNIDGSYPRQGWVVWEEAGRYPDVIIELMSPSTATIDVTEKKDLYEQTFRNPDYFVYDPFNADSLQGWHLDANQTYQPLIPNENGQLWCQSLGLWVGVWQGTIDREVAPWLRFYDQEGNVVPLPEEAAQQQAEAAQQQAEAAQQQAAQLEQSQRNAIPQLLATGMTVEQVAAILSVSVDFVQQVANSEQ